METSIHLKSVNPRTLSMLHTKFSSMWNCAEDLKIKNETRVNNIVNSPFQIGIRSEFSTKTSQWYNSHHTWFTYSRKLNVSYMKNVILKYYINLWYLVFLTTISFLDIFPIISGSVSIIWSLITLNAVVPWILTCHTGITMPWNFRPQALNNQHLLFSMFITFYPNNFSYGFQ